MNFDIYKTSSKLNINKISKKPSSFWIRRNPKSDIELFHLNIFSENLVHSVFFISDEYQVGTKKSGSQISIPFNQYVNTFIFPEKGYVFIEFVYQPYSQLVLDEYKKIFKAEFAPYSFTNIDMANIKNSLEATISEVNYKNTLDDELFNLESRSEINDTLPSLFSDTNEIFFLLYNINNNLVSIKNNKVISIGNDDDEFLIKICEEIIDAIDKK